MVFSDGKDAEVLGLEGHLPAHAVLPPGPLQYHFLQVSVHLQ